jgi:hypothetical protein
VTFATPRLIELCFQTAGIWEMNVEGRMGLPQHADEVRLWSPTELDGANVRPVETLGGDPKMSETRFYAVVTPHPDRGSFDAQVVDDSGRLYVRLIGYRTVALSATVDASLLKAWGAAA